MRSLEILTAITGLLLATAEDSNNDERLANLIDPFNENGFPFSGRQGSESIVSLQDQGFLESLTNASNTPTEGAQRSSYCREIEQKINFDPFLHKTSYTIGVHAPDGLDSARREAEKTLGAYLTETAGKRFDPPIEFKVEPYFFEPLFQAIQNDEIAFVFANPGIFSCIGTQVGATALATVVRRQKLRNKMFELDVYGGVIAVRHDNDEINSIPDLKDKVIAATAITDLMAGQMQIYEMILGGMSYVLDPKQFVFTKVQEEIIRGVLKGSFDAGFVRTNQIEVTRDENGELIDPSLFKIIDPKMYIMDNGEMFPFLHSTDILPGWPLAALENVPRDVQSAVQSALMDFKSMEIIGQQVEQCMNQNSENYCFALDPFEIYPSAPCYATTELGYLALSKDGESNIAGWRSARSYFDLREIQQRGGFLVKDSNNNWQCTRPSNLYEGITCPEGYYKRSEIEFNLGCSNVNMSCDDNPDYTCFCKPCVKAFEVDIYTHVDGESDPHHEVYFGDELPGCEKMSICGTIQQGDAITLRIYDNVQRDNPKVDVIVHAGDRERHINVKKLAIPHAYEFTVSDNLREVQVIDVLFDGVAVSQSPIRVIVEDKDCGIVFGVGSHRVADAQGNCICAGDTFQLGETCLESVFFFLIIFAVVFTALGIILTFYLGYKKQQNDSVWHINPAELHFNEPPEVIGQGAFGVVILGQYRGTKVAVKRVLPPSKVKYSGSNGALSNSMSDKQVPSLEIGSGSIEDDKADQKKKSKEKKKNVKFGSVDTGDVESQSLSRNTDTMGSISGSGKSWERMLAGFNSDNNILQLLNSATMSDHGSGTNIVNTMRSGSSQVVLRMLPKCLRFDEHSRKVNEFVVEMRMLSRLRHPCITTVMGAVISSTTDPMLVMEFMEYGSLHDLLHNETMTTGGEIILQIVRDIVQGIHFLHASKPPILHGDLKAKNILVDSRFRAKVADFGFSHVKSASHRNVLQGTPFYMAPEYLRRRSEYSTACDIYSFAMILYEVYARASPFDGEDPRKILPKVCHPRINKRPIIPPVMPPKMAELMKKCWGANPFFRPSAKDIDYLFVEMKMEDAEPLEDKHANIREAIHRKPASLYDVFPKHIADALNAGKKVEAESHEIVTVVFSDIVGFETIAERLEPIKVSRLLDRLYQAFDEIANQYHIFKVETVGDAYMGVTNLDGSEFDTHVKQVAEFAQGIVRAASQVLIDEDEPSMGYAQTRVGFHSGPVVSNVIGTLNPRYGLFGDTVNTASRMESNSMPGKIHCSFASAQLLQQQAPGMIVELRGMIKVKGKGKMKTYWVGGSDLTTAASPPNSVFVCDQTAETAMDDHSIFDHEDDPESKRPPTPMKNTENKNTKCLPVDASKDHFIGVHCVDDEMRSHKARLGMDGSLQQ